MKIKKLASVKNPEINTIRDNIPVENLLKQYIDETQEVDVIKTEKIVPKKPEPINENTTQNISVNTIR